MSSARLHQMAVQVKFPDWSLLKRATARITLEGMAFPSEILSRPSPPSTAKPPCVDVAVQTIPVIVGDSEKSTEKVGDANVGKESELEQDLTKGNLLVKNSSSDSPSGLEQGKIARNRRTSKNFPNPVLSPALNPVHENRRMSLQPGGATDLGRSSPLLNPSHYLMKNKRRGSYALNAAAANQPSTQQDASREGSSSPLPVVREVDHSAAAESPLSLRTPQLDRHSSSPVQNILDSYLKRPVGSSPLEYITVDTTLEPASTGTRVEDPVDTASSPAASPLVGLSLSPSRIPSSYATARGPTARRIMPDEWISEQQEETEDV